MFRKISAAAGWAILCFIAYASISSIAARPSLHVSAHLEHIAAFASVGLLFYFGYPSRVGVVLIVVIGSAALLELLQLATIDRHARVADMIEKMLGGGIGLVAGRALLRYEPAFREWARLIATAGPCRVNSRSPFTCDPLSRAPGVHTPSHRPERPD